MSKTCPILQLNPSPLTGDSECKEHECAWWIDEYVMPVNGANTIIPGKCAIREIGTSLESIRLDGIPQF